MIVLAIRRVPKISEGGQKISFIAIRQQDLHKGFAIMLKVCWSAHHILSAYVLENSSTLSKHYNLHECQLACCAHTER